MVEGRLSSGPFRKELADLLGIEPAMTVSEHLTASYLRFEGTANPLQKGMEDTQLIPHRGHVVYCKPSLTLTFWPRWCRRFLRWKVSELRRREPLYPCPEPIFHSW